MQKRCLLHLAGFNLGLLSAPCLATEAPKVRAAAS